MKSQKAVDHYMARCGYGQIQQTIYALQTVQRINTKALGSACKEKF